MEGKGESGVNSRKKKFKRNVREEIGEEFEDLDEEILSLPKPILVRYKTELCKSYIQSKECKFGDKCHFAHGVEELRKIDRHRKYKTERCKLFHEEGFCPFGHRCSFLHTEDPEQLPPSHGERIRFFQEAAFGNRSKPRKLHASSSSAASPLASPLSNGDESFGTFEDVPTEVDTKAKALVDEDDALVKIPSEELNLEKQTLLMIEDIIEEDLMNEKISGTPVIPLKVEDKFAKFTSSGLKLSKANSKLELQSINKLKLSDALKRKTVGERLGGLGAEKKFGFKNDRIWNVPTLTLDADKDFSVEDAVDSMDAEKLWD